MKTSTIATLVGVGAFAAGCMTIGLASVEYVKGVDNKFTGLSKGMSYIHDNIDLNIPAEVADELVKAAARDVATEVVNKAAESAKKEVVKDINNAVKGNVKNAYAGIEESLKAKLEKEINIQTLEKIENKVAEKVAKQVISNYSNPFGASKADIAKACIDNGMDGFDVARVMSSIK